MLECGARSVLKAECETGCGELPRECVMKQRTLKKEVTISGFGLHSGAPVTMTCMPAPAGSGILWRVGSEEFKMGEVATLDAAFATVVCNASGARLSTIEHVMAALWALGIDTCEIHLTAPEPPAADGSAEVFMLLLADAGVHEYDVDAPCIAVSRSHVWRDDVRKGLIELTPHETSGAFSVTYRLTGPQYGPVGVSYTFDSHELFIREFVSARTCGRLSDLAYLRERGLAGGSSSGNTLILSQVGVPLTTPRWSDEHMRHKVLDFIGDLFLMGCAMSAHIVAENTGHNFNRVIYEAWRSGQLE